VSRSIHSEPRETRPENARSILDNGGVISGASDWPVSSANVFWAIYQAETRKGPEGVLDPSRAERTAGA
jgi:predicted amidohydrolase YtcJ